MTFSASPQPESDPTIERKVIRVNGVVQGVGFRPFVYRLASEEDLAGFIGNDTDGVTIELEGQSACIQAFLARLTSETPPLARIDSVATRDLAPTGETGFRTVASELLGRVSTALARNRRRHCGRLSPTRDSRTLPCRNCRGFYPDCLESTLRHGDTADCALRRVHEQSQIGEPPAHRTRIAGT